MLSLLFCAYVGFGLGMARETVAKCDIYYKGFLVNKPKRELKQMEYAAFVVGCCFAWPATFWTPVKRAFILKNKVTGNEYPI